MATVTVELQTQAATREAARSSCAAVVGSLMQHIQKVVRERDGYRMVAPGITMVGLKVVRSRGR